MQRLAEQVGLKRCQVYKWHWDEKKKEEDLRRQQQNLFQVHNENGEDITGSSNIFKIVKDN